MKDENGNTVDWLSIYRHGKENKPENVWGYTFKSFFRDDMGELYNNIKANNKFKANFGVFEIVSFATLVLIGLYLNWKALLFFVPFYYLGNCLSSLNGYYEHLGSNPKLPIAWGVSCYNKLYNLIWFNNGYHAEHHYKPKYHWTKMKELHQQINDQQKTSNVHVINHCHALGFLDKSNQQITKEYASR
jgi:fatty acid desaturase